MILLTMLELNQSIVLLQPLLVGLVASLSKATARPVPRTIVAAGAEIISCAMSPGIEGE